VNILLQRAATTLNCAIALIERWFAPLADLAVRLYVAQVFFSSGLTKIHDWDTTIALFTDEYRVPLLPPQLAAVMGASGELFFPVLLVLGLGGRLGAIGLTFVNIMAVVSYWHVLMAPEQMAGLYNHYQWAIMLALLIAHGPGKISVDFWIKRRWAGKVEAVPAAA
jgi:putative oxidoreductase